ncbi:MAG: hypothetical protein JWO83_1852 [Caulobacteraceae bacterium]|jgi:hypothetical protein|nr:hypothetical protein [Caulobacteraceae bacterium]
MRPLATALVFGLLAVILTACAAGTPDAGQAAAGGPLSQLVLGFWHGLIAPITLLIEVIHRYAPSVLNLPWRMYGGNGSVPYDIGFYFGLAGGPSFIIWRR